MLNVKVVERASAVHPSHQRVAPVITKTKEEEKNGDIRRRKMTSLT